MNPSEHVSGREYHRAYAGEKRRIGRGVLAIALVFVGLFGFGGVAAWAGAQADLALGYVNPTLGGDDFTPVFHASNAVGIALLIPWAILIQRWLYGVRGATLLSVRSRFRFDVFGRALLLIGPVAVLTVAGLSLISPASEAAWTAPQLIGVLTVTLLLTPLQAAGEEFGFRGVVFRAASSWARGPRAGLVVGVGVSTIAFTVMHPATSVWLTVNYAVLGLCASLITWRTGGIEIAVVLHALNNVLSSAYAQTLHHDLLERNVDPTILLVHVPAVITAVVVLVRGRGIAPPTFPKARAR